MNKKLSRKIGEKMKYVKWLILTLCAIALVSCNQNQISENENVESEIVETVKNPIRKITKQVEKCSDDDIVDGVTQIDTSDIWTPVEEIDFSSKHDVWIMNSDGSLTPMDEPYFESELITDRTYRIRSDGDYCYAIAGDDIGIMFDCGYGAGNVRKYAEGLLGVPIKYVVNSHYHFDHTANDSYFDAVFMSEESIPYATVPYETFEGVEFSRDYPIITVEDGYKLNLGNRELEIIKPPYTNHTLGGIMMIDKENKLLWTGDEFLFPTRVELKYETLDNFKTSMEHINKYRKYFDKILAGTGEKDATMFDSYYTAAINAVLGTEDPNDVDETTTTSTWTKTEVPTDTGHIIYVRGQVRVGDAATDSPEVEVPGEAKTYIYNGFTISYNDMASKDSLSYADSLYANGLYKLAYDAYVVAWEKYEHMKAARAIGKYYELGAGDLFDIDYNKAIEYYEKGSAKGDGTSYARWTNLYITNKVGNGNEANNRYISYNILEGGFKNILKVDDLSHEKLDDAISKLNGVNSIDDMSYIMGYINEMGYENEDGSVKVEPNLAEALYWYNLKEGESHELGYSFDEAVDRVNKELANFQ